MVRLITFDVEALTLKKNNKKNIMINNNFIRIQSEILYAEYEVYTIYFVHNFITIIISYKVLNIILKFFID